LGNEGEEVKEEEEAPLFLTTVSSFCEVNLRYCESGVNKSNKQNESIFAPSDQVPDSFSCSKDRAMLEAEAETILISLFSESKRWVSERVVEP
jgi:hypothetical protein